MESLIMNKGNTITEIPIGFPGRYIVENVLRGGVEAHRMLSIAKKYSLSGAYNNNNVDSNATGDKTALQFSIMEGVSVRTAPQILVSECDKKKKESYLKRNKVLFFRNIFNSSVQELNGSWFSPATHYLASATKKHGSAVIFSDSKISLTDDEILTDEKEFVALLKEHRDINVVAITLCEDYFLKAIKLCTLIRKHSNAFIVVGGVMSTLTPEHVFVHLPDVNIVVRGAGEIIFPKILDILSGADRRSELTKEQMDRIAGLSGVLFKNESVVIAAAIDVVNTIDNFDDSELDFSFFDKQDVERGLNLYTARGCRNRCFFCTIPGRSNFLAKSPENIEVIITDYMKRLTVIFGKQAIPPRAKTISFNDDDFLSDPDRARGIIAVLKKHHFLISFFQTGINAFYIRTRTDRVSERINHRLIDSISPDLFWRDPNTTDHVDVYIGTENYNDRELRRLGKGYTFKKIECVIKELSRRKIIQAHHFIVSNIHTDAEALLDNVLKIANLKLRYGPFFRVLLPVIPRLISLYPSLSYKTIIRGGQRSHVDVFQILSLKSFPEYDYPLVAGDNPKDKTIVAAATLLISRLRNDSPELILSILDDILVFFLYLAEQCNGSKSVFAKHIYAILGNYTDYMKPAYCGAPRRPPNNIGNIQLMITNRCQLRCTYCPVIKGDSDMKETTVRQSIDTLMMSSRKDLRLDFTGGEPLLRFDLIKKAVTYAKREAKRNGKNISFYLVSNLVLLNDEMMDFFENERFKIEISIDGNESSHNVYKKTAVRNINPYKATMEKFLRVVSRNIDYHVVMVATPKNVAFLFDNFRHIYKAGARTIGINYALGSWWNIIAKNRFIHQLARIARHYRREIGRGELMINNFGVRREPAILNGELLVNPDGSVNYLSDWFFTRESGTQIPPLGSISRASGLMGYWGQTRFNILWRLFRYRPGKYRSVLMNNIQMGNEVSNFIEQWKNKNS